MTSYTATMTKVQDAPPLGEYKRTSVDDQKDAADARIISVDDGKFTLRTDTMQISGRGIKPCNGGYEVTRKALEKLQETYTIASDF
jgi:hypothetical protein